MHDLVDRALAQQLDRDVAPFPAVALWLDLERPGTGIEATSIRALLERIAG